MDLFQHAEMAEKLKERGLDAVESNSDGWVERMRVAAREICRVKAATGYGGTVTTDNLRRLCDDDSDQPHSPNAWGAIFRGRGWERVGYTKSKYSSNHGRRISVWRWVG